MSIRLRMLVVAIVVAVAGTAAGVWFVVGLDERRAITSCQDGIEDSNDAYAHDWAEAVVVTTENDAISLVKGTVALESKDGHRFDAEFECSFTDGAISSSSLTMD